MSRNPIYMGCFREKEFNDPDVNKLINFGLFELGRFNTDIK